MFRARPFRSIRGPRTALGVAAPTRLAPVVLFALALLAGCGPSRDRTAPPGAVLVVAVESMGWERIDALVARGELPNLGRMLEEGVRAPVRVPDPLDASMLWTSAFTGKSPGVHQVYGEFANLPDGTRTLVHSGMRPTKNLLQIAGQVGNLVASVGIPVTWPAEVVNGFLVAPGAAIDRWTATVEHTAPRQPSDRATFPPELWREIEPMLRAPDAIRREEVSRFFTLNESEFAMVYDQPLGSIFRKTNPLRDFAITHQRDLTYVEIALHLMQSYSPRLVTVHLELLDVLQPIYYRFLYPDLYTTPADSRRRYAETVDEGYRFVDEQIGRLVEALPANSTVIVISERGFANGSIVDDEGEDRAAPVYTNDAVMLLWGQGIAEGVTIEHAGITDLTPTVLALLGMPVAGDMDGTVLLDALDPAFREAHPRRTLPTYDTNWNQAARYPAGLAVPPDQAESEEGSAP